MPAHGLGKAAALVTVSEASTARRRLKRLSPAAALGLRRLAQRLEGGPGLAELALRLGDQVLETRGSEAVGDGVDRLDDGRVDAPRGAGLGHGSIQPEPVGGPWEAARLSP